MPKISKYKDRILKEKVIKLYKKGLNTREIGRAVERSHTWAWQVIHTYENGNLTIKNKGI